MAQLQCACVCLPTQTVGWTHTTQPNRKQHARVGAANCNFEAVVLSWPSSPSSRPYFRLCLLFAVLRRRCCSGSVIHRSASWSAHSFILPYYFYLPHALAFSTSQAPFFLSCFLYSCCHSLSPVILSGLEDLVPFSSSSSSPHCRYKTEQH